MCVLIRGEGIMTKGIIYITHWSLDACPLLFFKKQFSKLLKVFIQQRCILSFDWNKVYVKDAIVTVRSALLPSILATFQSRDLGFSMNFKNFIWREIMWGVVELFQSHSLTGRHSEASIYMLSAEPPGIWSMKSSDYAF